MATSRGSRTHAGPIRPPPRNVRRAAPRAAVPWSGTARKAMHRLGDSPRIAAGAGTREQTQTQRMQRGQGALNGLAQAGGRWHGIKGGLVVHNRTVDVIEGPSDTRNPVVG